MRPVFLILKLYAKIFAGFILVCGFWYWCYVFVQSDVGLFSDKTCMKFASNDVLGYAGLCPRASYADDVEYLHGSDNNGPAAIFKFHPIPGKEAQCPPIKLYIDRRTGEASIDWDKK